MCGFIYNVNDFPLLEPLLDIAGYSEDEIREIIREQYLRPTDTVINLVPTRTGPRLLGATWWLATNPDGTPNQTIASFNSKISKVQTSRLHTRSPRSIRSIIIAKGFCEWQPIYKGGRLYTQLPGVTSAKSLPKPDRKQQFLIEPKTDQLMLLASVSKLRLINGCPQVNTSVITLPAHDTFLDIHHKSFPLVLRENEIANWIDPSVNWSEFDYLTHLTQFRDSFTATPVDSILTREGEAQILEQI